MTKIRIIGVDLSPNHGAIIQLTNGDLTNYWYATDKRKVADRSKDHGAYIPISSSKFKGKENAHLRGMVRMKFWEEHLPLVVGGGIFEYAGLEDYAYRASQGAHQIGEIGGLIRLALWNSGAKIRLHDPMSAKIFVMHRGNADRRKMSDVKGQMVSAVLARWPETDVFKRYIEGADHRTFEDLCDAYAIAKLVWYEVQLRSGEMVMSELHEKEVQVFNRVTSSFPLNILGRGWLRG